MPKDSFYSWVHNTEYWDQQESVLLKIIYPDLADSISAGLDIGADEVFSFGGQPEAVLGEAWNIINRKAAAYANLYSYDLVKGIEQTTREFLQDKIPGWITGSDPLSTLINDPGMVAMFGEVRANMIATTEITRAFSQGNLMVWQNCDWVKGARWMTAMDELVCEICGQLDYKWVSFESGGFQYGTEDSVETVEAPPAHVNCRCWILPVTQGNADASPGTQQTDITPTLPDAPPPEVPGAEPPATGYTVEKYANATGDTFEQQDKLYQFITHGNDYADDYERGLAKDAIVKELTQRTGISYDDINEFIHQWAYTSNDSSKTALDIQRVAARLFNTEMSDWQQGRFAMVANESNMFENNITGKIFDRFAEMGFKNSDEIMEKLLTSMYEYTQEQFSIAGITEVSIERGMDLKWSQIDQILEVSGKGKTISIESNALESWSSFHDTAVGFSENGRGALVVRTTFPVERIIGTCRTGFGCLSEQELVVLGGKKYTGKELVQIIKIGAGSMKTLDFSEDIGEGSIRSEAGILIISPTGDINADWIKFATGDPEGLLQSESAAHRRAQEMNDAREAELAKLKGKKSDDHITDQSV